MRRDSAKRHIFGVAHPGGELWPQVWTGRDFCTLHLPTSFIILCLHVRELSCSRTNTNTQTNRFRRKHPTFFAMLWRWITKMDDKVVSAVLHRCIHIVSLVMVQLMLVLESFVTCLYSISANKLCFIESVDGKLWTFSHIKFIHHYWMADTVALACFRSLSHMDLNTEFCQPEYLIILAYLRKEFCVINLCCCQVWLLSET